MRRINLILIVLFLVPAQGHSMNLDHGFHKLYKSGPLEMVVGTAIPFIETPAGLWFGLHGAEELRDLSRQKKSFWTEPTEDQQKILRKAKRRARLKAAGGAYFGLSLLSRFPILTSNYDPGLVPLAGLAYQGYKEIEEGAMGLLEGSLGEGR